MHCGQRACPKWYIHQISHSWVLQVLNVDDNHLSVARRTEADNKATQAA